MNNKTKIILFAAAVLFSAAAYARYVTTDGPVVAQQQNNLMSAPAAVKKQGSGVKMETGSGATASVSSVTNKSGGGAGKGGGTGIVGAGTGTGDGGDYFTTDKGSVLQGTTSSDGQNAALDDFIKKNRVVMANLHWNFKGISGGGTVGGMIFSYTRVTAGANISVESLPFNQYCTSPAVFTARGFGLTKEQIIQKAGIDFQNAWYKVADFRTVTSASYTCQKGEVSLVAGSGKSNGYDFVYIVRCCPNYWCSQGKYKYNFKTGNCDPW